MNMPLYNDGIINATLDMKSKKNETKNCIEWHLHQVYTLNLFYMKKT